MPGQLTKPYTAAEYLAYEREATEKHEYYDGEIFAMSGATKEHVRIARNVLRHLGNQPFGSDLRAAGVEDQHVDVLLNPRVLVEVVTFDGTA
jgi:Uma2 family endonuclease